MFLTQLLYVLSFLSLSMAEETLIASGHNQWTWGHSSGVVGFIVLILDIIVWVEVLKSNRPPAHKVLWCLVVFLFPFVGLIVYWLFSDRAAHSGGSTYEVLP